LRRAATGLTGVNDLDASRHLTHNQFDVLVVDRHALVAVDVLDLFDQVLLGLTSSAELHHQLRVKRSVVQRRADLDFLAVSIKRWRAIEIDSSWSSRRCDDRDFRSRPINSTRTAPRTPRLGGALACGLEELDTRGRPCVMSLSVTPPEWKVRMVSCVPGSPMDCAAMTRRPHRARPTGASRATDRSSRHRRLDGVARQRRADTNALDGGVFSKKLDVVDINMVPVWIVVPLESVTSSASTRPRAWSRGVRADHGCRRDVLDPHAALGAAVELLDDQLLGDVDESTSQVAGVGRAKRRVTEALAGAVGRDEVLEDERPSRKDDLIGRGIISPRVGHEAFMAAI